MAYETAGSPSLSPGGIVHSILTWPVVIKPFERTFTVPGWMKLEAEGRLIR